MRVISGAVTARYIAQPDFKLDCADFADISDAPKAMMDYMMALHKFILAARPIEEDRRTVHKLRAFMKARQCTSWWRWMGCPAVGCVRSQACETLHARQVLHVWCCRVFHLAAVLYLQQEDLATMRRRVTEAHETHRTCVRELTLIEERKAELLLALKDTENLIRLGKMPPPRDLIMELPQSKALGHWDNRKEARAVIVK